MLIDVPSSIPEDRALTPDERDLLRWLLAHSDAQGSRFTAQIDRARVSSRCGCGCASVEFGIDGRVPERSAGLVQISPDYYWNGPGGGLCAVFVYAQEDQLAGLETWSVDGMETPSCLPRIEELRGSAPSPA